MLDYMFYLSWCAASIYHGHLLPLLSVVSDGSVLWLVGGLIKGGDYLCAEKCARGYFVMWIEWFHKVTKVQPNPNQTLGIKRITTLVLFPCFSEQVEFICWKYETYIKQLRPGVEPATRTLAFVHWECT